MLWNKFSWTLVTLILFTIFFLIIYHRRTIYLVWKYPKIQSYTFVPFLGHLSALQYINPSMKNFMKLCDYLSEESGKLCFALGFKTIMIYKANQLEVVFNHRDTQEKHYIYDFFEGFIGNSIFRIGGTQWKKHRKAMGPTMKVEAVAPYTEDMCTTVEILATKWKGKVGQTIDAMPDIAKCVMEMFVKAAFGLDIDIQKKGTKFDHYTDVFLELAMYRIISLLKHPNFVYKLTSSYKIQQEALDYGREYTDTIFAKRKEIYLKSIEAQKDDALIEDASNSISQFKFIDHLFKLKSEINFTDKNIKDEVNTFMIAGFDTCSSGISFTLISLAMYQDIQAKVYQELMDVLGPDRPVEYRDLAKFVYLEKVIKESMRLFPPAPIFARVADEEFLLDGHMVPKGTQLGCYILKTHRSPLYWKDPLTFDPERFSPAEAAKQEKYSYVPFAAGPRICFGSRVAWITLKTTIATLLRRYRFYTPYKKIQDINLAIKMTLKAEDGMLLRFESRT